MRKRLLIIGAVVLVLIVAAVSMCSNGADDEERNIIIGKDTIMVWQDTYKIVHAPTSDIFSIVTDGSSDIILKNVTDYEVKKHKLYIVSDEGYAVIDKECKCRVFVTVPDNEFVSQYSVDENGNPLYESRYLEMENITYLDSFEDFTEDERENFEKIEQ